MSPVLDYVETIDCVDMDHVACMGFSFGGFLMPRVAAFDKRIKLIITDPGNISWGKGIGERLAMIEDAVQDASEVYECHVGGLCVEARSAGRGSR